jgi:hypothetical protein
VCNALAAVLSQHKRQRAQIMNMGEESNRLQSDVRIALKGKDGMSARLDDTLRQLAHFQNQVAFFGTAKCNNSCWESVTSLVLLCPFPINMQTCGLWELPACCQHAGSSLFNEQHNLEDSCVESPHGVYGSGRKGAVSTAYLTHNLEICSTLITAYLTHNLGIRSTWINVKQPPAGLPV